MFQYAEKAFWFLLYVFVGSFAFLIYPWGKDQYYANAKAYYFIGWMLLLGALFVWNRLGGKGEAIWKWNSLEWVLLSFLFVIGCSTIHSQWPSWIGNLTEHQGFVVMTACTLFYVMVSRIASDHHQHVLIRFVVVSSIFSAVYGILQHAGYKLLPQDLVYRFGSRCFSFFDNPDYFGSYLVLAMTLGMALYLSSMGRRESVHYFSILCILFLSLLDSETRSAWVGTMLGFIILTVLVVWKRRELWGKWTILIAVFILIFSVSNAVAKQSHVSRAVTMTHDVQKIITNDNAGSAGASRWYIWQVSLPLIKDHFWLGSGPNTFEEVFHPHDEETKKYLGNEKIFDENNDYMQIALTMGMPALVLYLLFISMVIFGGIQKGRKQEREDSRAHEHILTYVILAAILGYLVQALFNISVISVAPYFWLLLGCAGSGVGVTIKQNGRIT